MSKTRVLVTGARGFIGGFLCNRLVDEGYDVLAFATSKDNTQYLFDKNMSVFVGDLTKPKTLRGVCDGIDIVFHLAARATNTGKKKQFYDSIYEGTKNLLEESVGKVSTFVYVSSFCAVGAGGSGKHTKGFTEDVVPYKTGSYYDDAKLDAESLVIQYHREKKLKAVIIRPSNVIGPGKGGWVTELMKAIEKGPLPIIDHGNNSASLIYVENLVDGMILAATKEIAEGKIHHFRDDYQATWKDYIDELASMTDKQPKLINVPFKLMWPIATIADWTLRPLGIPTEITRHITGLMGRDNDVDTTRAKEDLGWKTKVPYETAIEEIRNWVAKEKAHQKWNTK